MFHGAEGVRHPVLAAMTDQQHMDLAQGLATV
jgi:hypothetical protein